MSAVATGSRPGRRNRSHDALGSVRKVTDSTGAVVATYDYDAWGNALASTSDTIPNGGLQYRFVGAAGVRWDAATGLYYMRARWYDPLLQRFLSRDPKRVKPSATRPFRVFPGPDNLYCYAANCPTVNIDATGDVPWPVVVIGIGIGAGIYYGVNQIRHRIAAAHGVPQSQIDQAVSEFPPEDQGTVRQILDYYRDHYNNVTHCDCGQAADETLDSLSRAFDYLRPKGVQFSHGCFWRRHLGIKMEPENVTIVSVHGRSIEIYSGSDQGFGPIVPPSQIVWQ